LIAVTIKVHPAWTEALEKVAAQGVPVVIALGPCQPSEKVVRITIDDVEGSAKAISQLLDLGHDRIGMIMPPADSSSRPRREDKRGFSIFFRIGVVFGSPQD
jgi:DNA-binding LacI/PurR family transcriptional regulator